MLARVLAAAGAAALALAAAPSAGATATQSFGAPATIDGPTTGVLALGGVSLAQDGGGAVVYTRLVAGVAHVFVSVERAGAWEAPLELDAAGAPAASTPSVAVANGGRVAVVWVSAGTLYGAVEAAGTQAFRAPQPIAPASGAPALGMGISGTAYVAYAGPAANVIDAARLDRTSSTFAVLPAAMSAAPIALPATGAGPAITAAADGTGVVAWTQVAPDGTTHVMVRRVSAAGPSPVLDDATVPSLGGLAGGPADSPSLGVTYDSSSAWVAFRETLGGVSRVIVDRLLGDELRPPVLADSLAPAPGASSASTPSLAVNGNGQGLLACALAPANAVSLAAFGTAAAPFAWTPGAVLGAPSNAVAPGAVTALSADGSGVVAYSPAAGALDGVLVHDGQAGAATPISAGALGAIAPAAGLAAAADDHGDLLVVFAAGSPGSLAIAAVPVLAMPSAPRALGTQLWSAINRPVLRWQRSSDHWAPPTYAVYIDGTRVATTTSASYTPPAALPDGRHSWRVVATDALGRQTSSATRRLLIDAAPPSVSLTLTGARRAGARLAFTVTASAPSGVRSVSLAYGDGASSTALRSTHAFSHAGSYLVSVVVTDGAGVSAQRRARITIP